MHSLVHLERMRDTFKWKRQATNKLNNKCYVKATETNTNQFDKWTKGPSDMQCQTQSNWGIKRMHERKQHATRHDEQTNEQGWSDDQMSDVQAKKMRKRQSHKDIRQYNRQTHKQTAWQIGWHIINNNLAVQQCFRCERFRNNDSLAGQIMAHLAGAAQLFYYKERFL